MRTMEDTATADHAAAAASVATAITTDETQIQFDFSSLSSPPSTQGNYHAHRQNHNPSKLPAFRFTDRQKDPLALPSLLQLQTHGIPPSPVSPCTDQKPSQASDEAQLNITSKEDNRPVPAHPYDSRNLQQSFPVSPEPSPVVAPSPEASPGRSRATTFQSPTETLTFSTPSASAKRSVSLDSTLTLKLAAANPTSDSSFSTSVPSRPQRRPGALRTHRLNSKSEDSEVDQATKDWAHGQRELLLPKSVQRTATDDKRNSVVRRPPVSYKPPPASATPSTSIPPIRSFRSSGSRRSLVLDLNHLRSPSVEEDFGDPHDKTLRALEGRREDESAAQITPPDSAMYRHDADDSGDVFLRMSREESEPQSAVSRIIRSSHRRPLSAAIPSYQPTSPPQVTRRMSDLDTSKFSPSTERIGRALTYGNMTRDRGDDPTLRGSNAKFPPLTPRSFTFQEMSPNTSSASAYSVRRQSITDNVSALSSRLSSAKQPPVSAYTQGRSYHSSPLVPKSTDSLKQDGLHADHHTESSTSTAAPSTVWDELDDLKSRIHRLELTGKLPPTSGAAIFRASDERPPTATTNATTMSASPKRGSGGSNAPQADAVSTVSSSVREGQPLLQSAITKSKPFLAANVYSALETAAKDAMALSVMIGTAGQPGPISSGASNIGAAAGTITDRQLRRKADSICRSLTELCLALSESATQVKQQQQQQHQEQQPLEQPRQIIPASPAREPPGSPTITRFVGITPQRHPNGVTADRGPPVSVLTSPRAMSRLEEKRSSMLVSSALPSPSTRFSSALPITPTEASGRRTSLLIPRTRRATTEEPEDQAGRKSSILRTRRAGTEEPEESAGRKSSLLLRTRRAAVVDKDEEDTQLRVPSRAVTEVTNTKVGAVREYNPHIPLPSVESSSLASSALPRRRLASSTINTRLVQPSAPSGLTTRRYVDRITPDADSTNTTEKTSDSRPQRQFSLTQNSLLSRTSSLSKRVNRDSMLTNSSTTADAGSYR
ncbi:hypothetical protein BX600DRAFT_210113 [Xylariales sp. PMI_506]|nr:hypothetical protein BX600DRAFT_210113 [Xylariales sp. PMI_506]